MPHSLHYAKIEDVYSLIYSKQARKTLAGIPAHISRRLLVRMKKIASDLFVTDNNTESMQGMHGYFRLRSGDWRVIYKIETDGLRLVVVKIAPRGGVYDRRSVRMNPQIISNRDQEPAFAVLPYDEYMALIERLELLEDLRDCKDFEERLARGGEELIPGDVVERLVGGENPVKVWREHRTLTQEELGAEIGLSGPYLSQIESGKREGTVKVYAALAKALGVDIGDLLATADQESPTRPEAAPRASGMKRSRDRG